MGCSCSPCLCACVCVNMGGCSCMRERETHTHTQRQTDRKRDRDRERNRETETEREREGGCVRACVSYRSSALSVAPLASPPEQTRHIQTDSLINHACHCFRTKLSSFSSSSSSLLYIVFHTQTTIHLRCGDS